MILQRIRIIVGDAGFEPGTSFYQSIPSAPNSRTKRLMNCFANLHVQCSLTERNALTQRIPDSAQLTADSALSLTAFRHLSRIIFKEWFSFVGSFYFLLFILLLANKLVLQYLTVILGGCTVTVCWVNWTVSRVSSLPQFVSAKLTLLGPSLTCLIISWKLL